MCNVALPVRALCILESHKLTHYLKCISVLFGGGKLQLTFWWYCIASVNKIIHYTVTMQPATTSGLCIVAPADYHEHRQSQQKDRYACDPMHYYCLCIDMFYCRHGLNISVLWAPNCLICSNDVVCLLADMASCFWSSLCPYSTSSFTFTMGISLCMAISVKIVTIKTY